MERIGRNWIIQIKTSGECFTQPSQCLLYGVGSSIGRATDCGSVSYGFKSHPSPHIDPNSKYIYNVYVVGSIPTFQAINFENRSAGRSILFIGSRKYASVAQLVEHSTDNRKATGSSPVVRTMCINCSRSVPGIGACIGSVL